MMWTSGCGPCCTTPSLAPLLPCDPERLADLLDPAVDWVVVSTFKDDGGFGRKTRQWAADLYRQHGYGHYLHEGDAHAARTIDQPGLDVVPDGPAWQLGQRGDFVEGEGLLLFHDSNKIHQDWRENKIDSNAPRWGPLGGHQAPLKAPSDYAYD